MSGTLQDVLQVVSEIRERMEAEQDAQLTRTDEAAIPERLGNLRRRITDGADGNGPFGRSRHAGFRWNRERHRPVSSSCAPRFGSAGCANVLERTRHWGLPEFDYFSVFKQNI